MPSVTIPLAGVLNTRKQQQLTDFEFGAGRKIDQLFRNCDFDVIKNPITGDAKMYIQKRWGLSEHLSTGRLEVANVGFLVSVTGNIISAFGSGAGYVYINNTYVGQAGSKVLHITESSISGKQYYFITDGSEDGWYLVSDSYAQTAYTGNRTSGSPVISGIASTAGIYAGQAWAGDAGIPADTRVLSVDSATQITMTANATTGAGTSTVFTKTPLAKFIFTNFPAAIVGKFVYLDGYLFIMDQTNRRIYQSGQNNITSWSASNYITVQSSGETTAGIARVGSRIVALCAGSIEFFYNAGNPSGSVLNSQKELFRRIGVSGGSSSDTQSTVPVYSYSGDSVFFLGTVGGQSRGVYAITGAEIKKISTPEIDKQISRSDSVYWIISAFHDRGKNYVAVCETSSPERNFLFCFETGMWTDNYFFAESGAGWTVFSGGIVSYTGGSTADTSMVFCVNSDALNGVVYRLRSDRYTDNGSSFYLSCQTSKTDFGTENLKTVKNVAILGTDIQSAINYLSLDGSSGCYASTPDSASVTFTNEIEIIAKIQLTDYTPSAAYRIIAQDNTTASQSAFRLLVNTDGTLAIQASNGSSYLGGNSTASISATANQIIWVKANLDFDDGSSNRVTNYYTSIDGSTWTQLGSTVTTAGVVAINNSNLNLTIGATSTGTTGLLIGNVYYAKVLNGISGTTVVEFDPSTDASEGDTSFISSTGEVWTINGTALIVDGQVATLEYSDDDYSTWTNAGEFKLTTSNPRIYRLGAYRGGRAWRLTHSADSAFRAQALKFEYDVGKH